jgi:ADP-ribosylglycohydrolase
MLGAIAGDLIGSAYEWLPIKSKDFPLWSAASRATDDSILTIAVADCLLHRKPLATAFHEYVARYPEAGWGSAFREWARLRTIEPYNSWGNGSAMRVSPVAWAFDTEAEVLEQARASAEVTHNHPEGIKGAQATALAIFLARTGHTKAEISTEITRRFSYDLSRHLDSIRPGYSFDVSCQGSVPEALISFLDSVDFEDAIRNAISLGGDADTMACIAGAVAEAFYGGIPGDIETEVWRFLDDDLTGVVRAFRKRHGGSP